MLDLDDQTDHRQWTQQHLDAADLRIPSIAPTPPQGEIENDCMDVNVRGPGVYTTALFIVREIRTDFNGELHTPPISLLTDYGGIFFIIKCHEIT